MGFMDEIQRYTTNLNQVDPVFGGLIPRRQLLEQKVAAPQQMQQRPIQPRGAIQQLPPVNQLPSTNPMNFEVDWRGVNERTHRFFEEGKEAWDKLNAPQVTAGQILHASGIRPNEQFPTQREGYEDIELNREVKRTNIDATKQRIQQGDRRLDIAAEKQKNPNIKFMPVKGGNIMGFDAKTGDTYDTGVATNTLSESDRIKMQQENAIAKQDDAQAGAIALEDKRQAGKIEIEKVKPGSAVNPSQRRIAEDDSAAELLRDPRYAFLAENGIVSLDKAKGIVIDSAGRKKWETHLTEFEKELKAKTNEKINITRDKPGSESAPIVGQVKTYPNGNKARFDGTGWEMIPKG